MINQYNPLNGRNRQLKCERDFIQRDVNGREIQHADEVTQRRNRKDNPFDCLNGHVFSWRFKASLLRNLLHIRHDVAIRDNDSIPECGKRNLCF